MNLLAIDMGNTRVKAGVFRGAELATVFEVHGAAELGRTLPELVAAHRIDHVAYINVNAAQNNPLLDALAALPLAVREITGLSPGPLRNGYGTPHTLGADRWAAVHGALRYVAGGPLLVLDVGTAVTYDYVDETDTFLGGGIAPGLSMRYQALHAFSARLPQLEPGPAIQWLGGTTEEAIRAGVQFGLAAELQAHINWAHQQRPDQPPPAVFLTGGNAPYFEPLLQEAVHRTCPNLVLEGICQLVASPAAFAD